LKSRVLARLPAPVVITYLEWMPVVIWSPHLKPGRNVLLVVPFSKLPIPVISHALDVKT